MAKGVSWMFKVNDATLLDGAAGLWSFVLDYLRDSGAEINDGDTLQYGYWSVRFTASQDAVELWERDDDYSGYVPGVDRAVRYWTTGEELLFARSSSPRSGSSVIDMGAIGRDEIEPGLVAFLDPRVLAAQAVVSHTQDPPVVRPGPFVCVSVDGDRSEWSPVTTEYRPERLVIQRRWRSGGHPQWLRDRQYLNDGANLWRGPHEAFLAASRAEVTTALDRAFLSTEGLAAVQAEIEAQRRRRHRT
jgi:hypothetical protein